MEKTENKFREHLKLPLFSVPSSSRRRKHKHFSYLILFIVASMSLYLATYFHAVASRWKTGKSVYWLSHQQIQRHPPQQKQQQQQQQVQIQSGGFENASGIILERNSVPQAIIKNEEGEERSLEEMSCLLPKLDPFDESIIEFIKPPPNIDCNSDGSYPNYFETDFKNTLIQTHSFLSLVKENPHEIQCCYQTFHREHPTSLADKGTIRFSNECFRIVESRQKIPQEHEFIYIQCKNGTNRGNHTDKEEKRKQKQKQVQDDSSPTEKENDGAVYFFRDMFAFVPLKSHVEQRVARYKIDKPRKISNQDQNTDNKIIQQENRRQKNDRGKRKWKESNTFESQARKHDEEEDSDDDENHLNVLLLGLDAQSHMNFLRQMPLTVAYLMKNLSAIGLSGYGKVGDNTYPNLVPLLTGLNTTELSDLCWNIDNPYFDDCPFIWKNFSTRGYRTLFAEDSIWMSIFTYNKPGFSSPPTDYYLHPFMDLMAKSVGHEMCGNSELCYGNRLAFQILLDYIIKTAITFQGERKDNKNNSKNIDVNVGKKYFQFVFVSSLFHDFLNLPKLGDELLVNTIKYLHGHNYLNNTLLLVHSDHGIRFGPIRTTLQGKIEENMPLAYIVPPTWFHDKYPHLVKNLKVNSQRLTTPFDIHETLLDLLNLKSLGNKDNIKDFETQIPNSKVRITKFNLDPNPKPKRGISLFNTIPMSRTCEDAEIEAHYCPCNYENTVQISSETLLAKMAAEFVLQTINELLFDLQEEGICAKLKLSNILKVLQLTQTNKSLADSFHSSLSTDRKKSHKDMMSTPKADDEINKNYSDSDGDNNKDIGSKATELVQRSSNIQITLLTEPGNGKFEATIVAKNSGQKHELSNFIFSLSGGGISRINLYGSQSTCIANAQRQKFCYCVEN